MYPEPSGSPLVMEQYKTTTNTTGTKSTSFSIQNLIVTQLAHIDYLKTIQSVNKEQDTVKVLRAVQWGLRSIESKLHPFLEEDYKKKSEELKNKIRKAMSQDVTLCMDYLSDWEDLIVDNLGLIDLLPQGSKELEVD